MKRIQSGKGRFAEIFRFTITGGLSFVVDYGMLLILTELCGWNVLLANTVSFTLSVIFNYLLCVLWVFRQSNRRNPTTILVFIGSSVIGLLFNDLLMWGMVDWIKIHYMVAKVIATILVMIWNYFAKRKAAYL